MDLFDPDLALVRKKTVQGNFSCVRTTRVEHYVDPVESLSNSAIKIIG